MEFTDNFRIPAEFDSESALDVLERELFSERNQLGSTDPEQTYAEEFLPAGEQDDTTITMGVQEGLNSIIANSKNKNFKRLAERIKGLVDYDIYTKEETNPAMAGSYDFENTDMPVISLERGRPVEDTEETIIHEAIHAATAPRIKSIDLYSRGDVRRAVDIPEDALEQAKQMRAEWGNFRSQLFKQKREEYGTADEAGWEWKSPSEQQAYYNLEEFFVRSLVDKDFQEQLDTMKPGLSRGDKVPLWEKLGDSLGLVTAREGMTKKDYTIENGNRLIDALQDIEPDWEVKNKIDAYNEGVR